MKRKMGSVLAAAAISTGAIGAAQACDPVPPDPEIAHCYDESHVVEEAVPGPIPWPKSERIFTSPMTFEAYDQTFSSGSRTDVASVKLRTDKGLEDSCFVGGTVTSSTPPDSTWEIYHHNYGVQFQVPATLAHTTVHNVGDGVSGGPMTIHGVNMYDVHDDCIQDDGMHAVTITDSVFGCGVFASAYSGYDRDGSMFDFKISGSMVRLQAFHESYDPVKYGHGQHGGFFKWQEGRSPRVVVDDSWFRADQPGKYGGNVNGWLALPPGSVCGSVTLVGTEVWQARDITSWVDQCENVEYAGVDEWDAKVKELE